MCRGQLSLSIQCSKLRRSRQASLVIVDIGCCNLCSLCSNAEVMIVISRPAHARLQSISAAAARDGNSAAIAIGLRNNVCYSQFSINDNLKLYVVNFFLPKSECFPVVFRWIIELYINFIQTKTNGCAQFIWIYNMNDYDTRVINLWALFLVHLFLCFNLYFTLENIFYIKNITQVINTVWDFVNLLLFEFILGNLRYKINQIKLQYFIYILHW